MKKLLNKYEQNMNVKIVSVVQMANKKAPYI